VPRLALVTCQTLPEPDPDAELLISACRSAGFDTEYVAWEDEDAAWNSFDLAVVRSTWNYYMDETAFRAWIDRVSTLTALWNLAELLRWNLHKAYLLELATGGVPIVPTRIVTRQAQGGDLAKVIAETKWDEFVVKPAVSASSYKTRKFLSSEIEPAGEFLQDILADRDAFIQKYLPRVAEGGEAALVHIGGELSHGIVKNPRFHGMDESVSEGFQPSEEQRAVASQVLGAIKGPWLYARVDLMLDDDGKWLLSELELVEPSLYFLQHPPALNRFAKAILGIAGREVRHG